MVFLTIFATFLTLLVLEPGSLQAAEVSARILAVDRARQQLQLELKTEQGTQEVMLDYREGAMPYGLQLGDRVDLSLADGTSVVEDVRPMAAKGGRVDPTGVRSRLSLSRGSRSLSSSGGNHRGHR